MAQHELNLPVVKDTYTDSDYPSTNFASAPLLKLSTRQHCLFEFDYSAIPTRKNILSALLNIYQNEVGASVYIYAQRYHEAVNLDTVTANSEPTAWGGATSERIAADTSGARQIPCTNAVIHNKTNNLNALLLTMKSDTVVTFNSKEAASNQPTLTVIYEDVPPSQPTLVTPIGVYKDSSSEIRFEWEYNSSVGGEQKKFDLQWSTNQSDWTTVSETTEDTHYDMPADTFPAGNIYWRVRTYNEYDEASEWSDIQSFYAVGAPNAPTISSVSAGTARPTVSWAAFNQQIYQLQILLGGTVVYDSSEQPGINTRQHKVTAWLTDGNYTARIRIKNEYDMWSEWGSTIFTVSTAKPQKPSFSLQRSSHGIEINIQGTDDYALIYRAEYGSDDFICIGNVTSKYFHDCSVKSGTEYRYFVRAASVNETYADSDVKLIQAEIRHSLIAPISDLTDIFEFRRSLNAPPKRNYTRALGGSTVEYEGRKYPVFIPDEHVSAGLALTFFLNSWRAVEKFMGLYDRKETVLYRDSKGRKIYGVLSGLSVEEEREGYTVSFVISQVDHDEEVEV